MSAVTKDVTRVGKRKEGLIAFPVKSGETIYSGTLVAIGNDGYLYNLDSASAIDAKMVGVVADETAITSGPAATTASGSISGDKTVSSAIAGDKTVRQVWTQGVFKFAATTITQAMLGTSMYASDNNTINDSAVGGVLVGQLVTYISASEGYIELNKTSSLVDGGTRIKQAVVITSADAGGAFAIKNPLGVTGIVSDLIIDVTAASTAAVTVDAGVAADGTTTSDTLIDGLSLAAIGTFSNLSDPGTNGGIDTIASTAYVTGDLSTATAIGSLVATVELTVRSWT